MKRLNIVGVIVLSIFSIVFAQKEQAQLIQVADRLYAVSGLGGNVAFLVTNEGVLVIDAGNSPSDGNKIIKKIQKITNNPIKYLVLTHYHSDHTNGMQAFSSTVVSIGQKNIIDNLHERKTQDLKDAIEHRYPANIVRIKKRIGELKSINSPDVEQEEIKLTATESQLEEARTIKIIDPVITFDKEYSIILGTDTVDIIYPGNAHTKCNSVVYFRTQKVVHTGDLVFEDSFPFIAWQDGVNTKNWIESLGKMAKDWQIAAVIPGHGSVTNKDGLLKMAEYLTDLRAEVDTAMKKGQSLDEMKKSITMPKYKNYKRPYGLVQNIESVYHEFSGK